VKTWVFFIEKINGNFYSCIEITAIFNTSNNRYFGILPKAGYQLPLKSVKAGNYLSEN